MNNHTQETRIGSTTSPNQGGAAEPIVDLPRILLRRRWWVIASVAVCLGMGVAYSFVADPVYTGVTRLSVTERQPVDETGAPRVTLPSPGSTNYLYTQARLMLSEAILEDVLGHSGLAPVLKLKRDKDPVEELRKRLVVEVDDPKKTLTLSAVDANAEVSSRMANAVVDAYIQFHASKKRSSSEQALSMLDHQQRENNADLKAKRQAMEAFQRETGLLEFEAQNNEVEMQRLENLSQAYTEAQLNALEAKADYDADMEIAQGDGDAVIQLKRLIESQRSRGIPVPLDTVAASQRNELRLLGIRLANLREQFTDASPAIRSLTQRIEELRLQMADEQDQMMGHLIVAVEKNWQAAQSKFTEVRHSLEAHKDRVELARNSSVRFNALLAQVTEAERLAEIYDEKIRALSIAEDVGALGIEVLNTALVPEKATSNPAKRILAMTLAMGLVLGGLLALWKEFRDPRLWSPKELVGVLRAPLLGVTPHMGGLDDHQRACRAVHRPDSSAAEAFRSIRTALFYQDPKTGAGAKTVLVTSPRSGQGKTTLAANLAITMAQAGCRTLLLDANLRHPAVHDRLETHQGPGLAKLLTGAVEIEAAVCSSKVSNLHVLPAGRAPMNPAEILNSHAFAETLQKLGERYDYIVMDSPATVRLTDSRILATLADATLLALEANPARPDAEQAVEGLRSVGANLVGLVVTNMQRDEKNWNVEINEPETKAAPVEKRLAA